MKRNPLSLEPGLTWTSVVAILLALLLEALFIQWAVVKLELEFPSEHVIPIPALLLLLGFTFASAVSAFAFRFRLLRRAELLCLFFAMVIAAPLMSQAFWHRVTGILATNPRVNDLARTDAMGDRIWPHGPNLLADAFSSDQDPDFGSGAGMEVPGAPQPDTLRLSVSESEGEAVAAFPLPLVTEPSSQGLMPGEPVLISFLVHFQTEDPASELVCRIRSGSDGRTREVFRTRQGPKVTFQQPDGFVREGRYGFRIPADDGEMRIELVLSGSGVARIREPVCMSVSALENLYQGVREASSEQWAVLPPGERSGLVEKPERFWSVKGLGYALGGAVPWGQWRSPLLVWSSLFLMLLLASFAITVIFRRQWMESERFSMPVGRMALQFFGEEEDGVPPVFRQRIFWIGFGVCLVWVLLRGWHFYNPGVPDTGISIPLSTYFSDPGWGQTFVGVTFTVGAIFLAIGIFMELNVSMSLVAGFLGFRLLYWLGETTGLNAYSNPNGTGYPWGTEMQIGGFLAYGLLLIVFSRKYLVHVVRVAFGPGGGKDAGEALSYRACLLLVLATFVGMGFWADWVEVPRGGMLLIYFFLVLLCVVSARLRAECGVPFGYFGSALFSVLLFVSLFGGMRVFGVEGVMMALLISFFIGPTPFLLLPGAQLEFLEIGRRFQVRPRDLFLTTLLGIAGGMLIGGWVFLTSTYSEGADQLAYRWAFDTKPWYFQAFNVELADATRAMQEGASDGVNRQTVGFGLGAGVIVLLSVLRQLFAGFAFHPAGFLLAPSWMMSQAWGSLLMAWTIRWSVLKIGGAVAVRSKLLPFFAGFLLGACVGQGFWFLHGQMLQAQGVELLYRSMP